MTEELPAVEVKVREGCCQKCGSLLVNTTGGSGAVCLGGCGAKIQPPLDAALNRKNLTALKGQTLPLAVAIDGVTGRPTEEFHTTVLYRVTGRAGCLFRRVGRASETTRESLLVRTDALGVAQLRLARWEEGEVVLGLAPEAVADHEPDEQETADVPDTGDDEEPDPD